MFLNNFPAETDKIIFERTTLMKDDIRFADSNQDLVVTELHLEGAIGDWDADIQQDNVEVDFANENVGFGKTGTQVQLEHLRPQWGS